MRGSESRLLRAPVAASDGDSVGTCFGQVAASNDRLVDSSDGHPGVTSTGIFGWLQMTRGGGRCDPTRQLRDDAALCISAD